MASISAGNICYSIGTTEILKDISFSASAGDRIGIVGINGSGKSTLMKILAGVEEASGGELYIQNSQSVGFLHQSDSQDVYGELNEATLLEQMYSAFPSLLKAEEDMAAIEEELASETDHDRIIQLSDRLNVINSRYVADGGMYFRSRCKSILISLGFDESYHSMSPKELSGGQRARFHLAVLLSMEPEILLLDEPTNHLDTDTVRWLENHLSTFRNTLIVVSHDRYFLDKVTNRTLDIENHTARMYNCSYSKYTEEKLKRYNEEKKKYDLQQKEIARQEAYIENQKRWGREKNIIAAKSREKAIDRMEKIDEPYLESRHLGFTIPMTVESGNDVLTVENLSGGYPGRKLFSDLSFEVKKKDRLFISGPNGCGKTTLIKILVGELLQMSGSFEFGHNVETGYYSQQITLPDSNLSVIDTLWDAYPDLTQTKIRGLLASFMFRGEDVFKQVSVLSGGEAARLALAMLIPSGNNLLILDEPTNHLDIDSREALERALTGFEGTVIAVSHDRYFASRLGNSFLDISEDGCLYFRGNYEDFRAYLESREQSGAVSSQSDGSEMSAGKADYLKKKADNSEKRRIRNRLDRIKKEQNKLESRISEIEELMTTDIATDYVKLSELDSEKTAGEEKLMLLYEEEEQLSSELEKYV